MFTGARYARSGDVNIAYQVVGDGPRDLVVVMGWVSHLAYFWELPSFAAFLGRLASFSRLILLDKRGTGLSDRVADLPSLEVRMDDLRAVMDAVGSQCAAVLGISEGATMCALFAATYPERTSALVMMGGYAASLRRPGYPWGLTEEGLERYLATIPASWENGDDVVKRAPSQADNEGVRRWWATFKQMSSSPGAAIDLMRMNSRIDIREALPAIRVPTLVIHARGDRIVPIEVGRYLAEHIPGARLVELPHDDHWPFVGDMEPGLDEVEEFLTGVRRGTAPDTVLATVLCTEVVQAGAHAVWLGDRRWTELVHRHHELVRQALNRYGGREVEAGDRGVVAVFDGTARAIRCAIALRDELLKLGLRIRAAIHAGECEVASGRPRGLALRLTAAFTAAAQLGEVLVSSTVKDLVVGSGIEFAERGSREVEGVPGAWPLFAAGPAAPPPEDHPPPSPATALSRRESEVAGLLASGLSNKEISSRLYLSERTVDNHVHHILAKLGFDSRVQVASWLARNEHTRLSTR